MAKYRIIKVDPKDYKQQILDLWKNNLPTTKEERFDWLNSNPCRPAIWFLAFHNKTNELAGSISILPRLMSFNGKTIRAGILGDFMVDSKHRVFGPNMLLPKTCIKNQRELGLDLIYTIPNNDSKNIIQRAGLICIGPLFYMVRPIRFEKYSNFPGIHLLSPIINSILKILTISFHYFKEQSIFQEENSFDDSFDSLWENIKKKQTGLIGDHSSEFLKWHFLQNPIANYRILTNRRKTDGRLSGYVIFTVTNSGLEIFDIFCLQMPLAKELINKVLKIAQKEKCKAIYCTASNKSPILNVLKRLFFFDSKFPMHLYINTDNNNLFSETFTFFASDRNI